MRRTSFVTAGLVGLSLLCGYVGYALGAPQTLGPCNTDAAGTCAFTCVLVQNSYPQVYIASVSQVQVPYCANTNLVVCNPKAAQTQCAIRTYLQSNCGDVGQAGNTFEPCCQ